MTPEAIFTAAFAKNRKNQPGILASPAELLSSFRRIYPVFWTIAARVNPAFFGASEAVALSSGAWSRPAEAESIFRIEDPEGTRVHVVPLDNRSADPFVPAVYEWGQAFRSAGNPNDPTAGELTFFFSKRPTLPDTATDELEELWPDSFNELLVLEMALVLAAKDERLTEVANLRADRDVWLRRFLAHLEHATLGVSRSTGSSQRFQGPSYIPITELLTGGTEVSL